MSMFLYIIIVVVTYSIITVRLREPNIFWWFVFCSGIKWCLPSAYLHVQNSYSMFINRPPSKGCQNWNGTSKTDDFRRCRTFQERSPLIIFIRRFRTPTIQNSNPKDPRTPGPTHPRTPGTNRAAGRHLLRLGNRHQLMEVLRHKVAA